jgi:hypothetical protein
VEQPVAVFEIQRILRVQNFPEKLRENYLANILEAVGTPQN